jgi:hypothetical protein
LGAVPNSDYWATLAQVLPVLALAVVVEARAISQRWIVETPKWLRFTQSLIWAVTLVVLALGESAALKALRGVTVWPWWTLLMENAIPAAVGLLILGPALDLLTKGYVEGFARIMTGAWMPRLRLALVERRELRQHRKLHALRQWAWQHLHWHEAVDSIIASDVAQVRAMVAETSESPLKEGVEGKLREFTALQEHAARGHEDARQKYRELVRVELEFDRAFRKDRIVRRRLLSEVRAAERHRVLRTILADKKNGEGKVGRPQSAFHNDEQLAAHHDDEHLPALADG